MKQTILPVICFFLNITQSFAQQSASYAALIKEAWQLYNAKSYQASGEKYAAAFAVEGDNSKSSDRYNAACSWALAGNKEAAFVQLFKIALEKNYSQYNHITVDSDLDLLHTDPRWQELRTLVKTNKEKAEANFDKPLIATLDSIYQDDQQHRMQLEPLRKKFGPDAPEVKALWEIITQKDSINVLKICKILDTRGWLGPNLIGEQGATTLFLVIQHANLDVQEKYLPMMREAVRQGNTQPGNLALLEDRVALRKGKKQIYGSQVSRFPGTDKYYVSPLEDPDNVDKRRAAVGLGPLADYVLTWNITWDPAAYKLQLPEIEAARKKQ